MAGCNILLYNRRADTMDGVSLSYTCVARAISGGLRMHAGTRIAAHDRLLTALNSLLKLITVLGSSAYRKATTGKKRAGRVGPWASRFLDVYTSTLLDF